MKNRIKILLLVIVIVATTITIGTVPASAASVSAPKNIKVFSKVGGFSVSFSNVKKATKYKIQYSTSSKFKNSKAVITKSNKKTITKLSCGKKYYVRIRAYKKSSASKWSSKKFVYTGLNAKAMKKKIISGYWFSYSPQDVGGDLYKFYSDGTVKIYSAWSNSGSEKLNINSEKWGSYSTSNNKVTIYEDNNSTFYYAPGKSYLKNPVKYSNPGPYASETYTIHLKVFHYGKIPTSSQVAKDWKNKYY